MKTVLFFTIAILAISFTSCGNRKTDTTDPGVEINGVRWATRNVAAPGTFAARPEDPGMLFQWNRQRGWTVTGEAADWDDSRPRGTMWERENDPCPEGWRVPTGEELQSLYNAGSVWTTQNGVNGRVFGSGRNQVFLPAVGWRRSSPGSLNLAGLVGCYWSSTHHSATDAIALQFSGTTISVGVHYFSNPASGLSVRCVAE